MSLLGKLRLDSPGDAAGRACGERRKQSSGGQPRSGGWGSYGEHVAEGARYAGARSMSPVSSGAVVSLKLRPGWSRLLRRCGCSENIGIWIAAAPQIVVVVSTWTRPETSRRTIGEII